MRAVPEVPVHDPDYLAKDYESFRTLMLDHLSETASGSRDRDPADVVVALVEVMAYVADYLSYYQDAVSAEAYIATARQRASVRRHARLVDYHLGERTSARVLVQIVPAADEVLVARGQPLLAGMPGRGVTVSEEDYDDYDGVVFETMHDVLLVRDHDEMALADGEELRPGATGLRLQGPHARLRRGDILILRHVETGFRHPIRLTGAAHDGDGTAVTWRAEDGLPEGVPAGGTWRAGGNVVLADHGRTREVELSPVPERGDYAPSFPCDDLAHVRAYDHAEALGTAVSRGLTSDAALSEPAVTLVERPRSFAADGVMRPAWTARRDLLSASPDDRAFAAEPDGHGTVAMRFGDGRRGRRPRPEWTYVARYRVGGGVGGNVKPHTLKHVVGLAGQIVSVANPLAAQGGSDPESLEDARENAPLARRRPRPKDGDRIGDLLGSTLSVAAAAEPGDGSPSAGGRLLPVAPGEEGPDGPRRTGDEGLPVRDHAYARVLGRMRRMASREPPLDRLDTAVPGDVTNALMSAWARVCDVLSFYGARIAEEGYLRTAREPRSVLYLADLLGVTRRPPVSAQTYLAAELFDAGTRAADVVVEAGDLSVQDAPTDPRQSPAIFESSERVVLKPSWNEVALAGTTRVAVPQVWEGCRSLRVVGTATGIRPGKALMISARDGAGVRTWLVTVASTLIDRATGTTVVVWDGGLPDGGRPWPRPADVVEAVLFRTSVGLFGQTAAAWNDLPEARRAATGIRPGGLLRMEAAEGATDAPPWTPWPNDLTPGAEVRAFVETPAGTLLIGTSKGVFRSTDGGGRWSRAMLAPLVPSIFALRVTSDGLLYAGGAGGGLFASVDDGVSWTSLPPAIDAASGAPAPKRRLFGFLAAPSPAPAPRSAVLGGTIRAIDGLVRADQAAGRSPARLIAGTDQGILARSATAWVPWNGGLPSRDASSGTAQVTVRGLLVTARLSYAATSLGLYAALSDGGSGDPLPDWTPLLEGRPSLAVISVAPAGDASAVLVGTDEGIFEITQASAGVLPVAPASASDLAGRRILSLARLGDRLFAGTDEGLFWSPLAGRAWQPCDVQSVELLTFDCDDPCRRALDQGRAPEALLDLLRTQGVIAKTSGLAVKAPAGGAAGPTGPSRIWIETADPHRSPETEGRVAGPAAPEGSPIREFSIDDGEPAVVRQRLRVAGPAVVGQGAGAVWAATPSGPPLNRDWPGFHIAGGRVFLDRAVQDIEPGSRMALADVGGLTAADPEIYPIRRAEEVRRTAFGRTATVTEVTLDVDPRQQVHAIRRTLVHLNAAVLDVYAPRVETAAPVEGDGLPAAVAPDGLMPGRRLLISGPRPRMAITRMGGVAPISGPPAAALLAGESVLALAALGPTVFVGTESGLVIERTGDGPPRAAGSGLPSGAIVRAFATHPGEGAVVAATEKHGVFCRMPDGAAPPEAAPSWSRLGRSDPAPVEALAVTRGGTVLAGTPEGVLSCRLPTGRSGDGPEDWSGPEIGRPVHCLAAGADGRCFAGLDGGLVWVRRPGAGWAALPAIPILPAPRVDALATGEGGLTLAGCEDGRIFVYAEFIGWRLVCRVARGAAVRSLLVADGSLFTGGSLFIGTRGQGAFVWSAGEGLCPAPIPESSDVRAMARTEAGAILAGRGASIHLDGDVPQVLQRRAFADAGAEAGPALDRGLLPPSLALIFAGAGAKLSASASVEVLERGARWLIRDRDRAWIAELLPRGLTSPAAPALLRLYTADLLELVAPPRHGGQGWAVVHDGHRGSFAASEDAVSLQAARSDQRVVREIAELARVDAAPGGTRLTLAAPLRETYDRKALRIQANLVPVTQGDTTPLEILGSGDATQAHQSFVLRRPVAGSRGPGGGVRPSLQVGTLGRQAALLRSGLAGGAGSSEEQPWRETASFLAEGPEDRVYMLRRDDKGRTSVHFGDGVHGARLPTGSENVVARYRSGAGRAGDVAPDTLVALRRRPVGIVAATNPAAATGGQDIQAIEDLRIRAPWQGGPTSGGVVSLDDYAAFATDFPGVDRARAQFFAPVRTVCLWIIADEGTSGDRLAEMVEQLGKAMQGVRLDRLRLHVESFTVRPFRIAARIVSRRAAHPDAAAQLRRRAWDALSARTRGCPASISREAVEALIRGVAGVDAVDVTALHAVGVPPRIDELRARPAWYDRAARRPVPPEVYLVRPADVVLDVRPA